MTRSALGAALLAGSFLSAPLCAAPASAAVEPKPGPDWRIRTIAYNPVHVVKLVATGLEPLSVVLQPGEQVVNVAGLKVSLRRARAKEIAGWYVPTGQNADKAEGDNASGQLSITDQLTLQPLAPQEPSVLHVRTKAPDGSPRRYVFEISTRKGNVVDPNDRDAYVEVSFSYPKPPPSQQEIAEARARRDEARVRREDRFAQERLVQHAYSAPRNRLYAFADGESSPGACAAIRPVNISDDGVQTKMRFAPGRPKPLAYVPTLAGKPSLADASPETTATGVLVTLPSVYRQFWLVLENQVCGVANGQHNPDGRTPGGGTGTISPDVVRQVRAPER